MRINKTLALVISSFCFLTLPLFFPTLGLYYFAPYLMIQQMRAPLHQTLWRGALLGVVIDLFTSVTQFGSTSLVYCLTLLLLSRIKNYLFQDKWISLPLLTALFALFATLLTEMTSFCFEHSSCFPSVMGTFFISLRNALYAWVIFVLPFQLYGRIVKMRTSVVEDI